MRGLSPSPGTSRCPSSRRATLIHSYSSTIGSSEFGESESQRLGGSPEDRLDERGHRAAEDGPQDRRRSAPLEQLVLGFGVSPIRLLHVGPEIELQPHV